MDLVIKITECECSVPFLVDDKLDLEFHLSQLENIVENLKNSGYKLAVDFSCAQNNGITVHGKLNVDVLKYMGPMELINYMKGCAFEFPQEIVPFGNISDLQFPNDKTLKVEICELNYNQVISDYTQYPVTHTYYVLDSKSQMKRFVIKHFKG